MFEDTGNHTQVTSICLHQTLCSFTTSKWLICHTHNLHISPVNELVFNLLGKNPLDYFLKNLLKWLLPELWRVLKFLQIIPFLGKGFNPFYWLRDLSLPITFQGDKHASDVWLFTPPLVFEVVWGNSCSVKAFPDVSKQESTVAPSD